ncbi:MAG: ABC transporter permease [Peptococcaceae bacterium]|jgi:ABC-2 type transport system permease protein|nr:ABC transporter permease [Peptococcaceae bacterium]
MRSDRGTWVFAGMFVALILILNIGVGYEMRANRMENIPLAILDQDESELSRTIITYMRENQTLTFYNYASSAAELETWLDQGKVCVGLVIPSGLAAQMVQGDAPRILVAYDASSLMVVSAAKSAMSEILLTLRGAYLRDFYEGKLSVVPQQALKNALPIDVTYRELYNPAKNFSNYLLLGMVIALLQVGFAVLGVERSVRGKQSYGSLLGKCLRLGLWGLLAMTASLLTQYLWFDLPYQGSVAAGIILTYLFAVCLITFGVLLGQVVTDRTFASQFVACFVLPTSILSGYTYPLFAMPLFFQWLGRLLPYTYYGEALRGLCLKGLGFAYVWPAMGALSAIIGVEFLLLGMVIWWKRRTPEGETGEAT